MRFGNRTVVAGLRMPLLCAAAILALASPASAGGNSVRVSVSRPVHQNVSYSVMLRGFAAQRDRLYLFVDYHPCAATPAAEHSRANGDIWYVNGSYKRSAKGWRSPAKAIYHGCGYLQKVSAPLNSTAGIVARGSVAYRVR